jgi:hypothetical protein
MPLVRVTLLNSANTILTAFDDRRAWGWLCWRRGLASDLAAIQSPA